MTRLFIVLISILLVLLTVLPALAIGASETPPLQVNASTAQPAAILTVTVNDTGNAPVAGAVVWIEDPASGDLLGFASSNAQNGSAPVVGDFTIIDIADANGHFRLPLLGGDWRIYAQDPATGDRGPEQLLTLTIDGNNQIDAGETITGVDLTVGAVPVSSVTAQLSPSRCRLVRALL
ncbi:hypothetical protein EDC39_107172 [Geothermobacter ehrlichii]|uniref:Uncharacterized protein n=1 Tax=Geothermobacter ehrlichii TaxID=213224 RepID=A0A5D3WJC6_9BACT|nr:hypothetical protein [Geothermobacter ehrlichii]TYO98371.1 hypothetical protein EDC39_107172 [Geothermobacter ehrlichii]